MGVLAYLGLFGAIVACAFWVITLAFVILAGAVLIKTM